MHAMLRPPIVATSWATARLDTVARPRWLSGMRKASLTGARTAICRRTESRSGLVAGSTSSRYSKGTGPSYAHPAEKETRLAEILPFPGRKQIPALAIHAARDKTAPKRADHDFAQGDPPLARDVWC